MVSLRGHVKEIAIGIVVFVVLLAIIILYFESAIGSLSGISVNSTQQQTGRLGLNLIPIKGAGFTYNNSKSYVGYSYFYYNIYNASRENLSFYIYAKNPVTRVYLLDVGEYCYRCLNESEIYQHLSQYMYYYGLQYNQTSLQFINYSDLSSVAKGSTVIIPSGLLPVVLLPGTSQNVTIFTLLDRGDTVIFVGGNFSESVGPGGVVYADGPQTMQAFKNYQINATPEWFPNSTNYLDLAFNHPLFNFTNGYTFSRLNYLYVHNGTLVVFPNFENNVYNSTDQLGGDLAKALFSRFWIPTYAYYNENRTITSKEYSGRTSLVTLNTTLNTSLSDFQHLIDSSYPLLRVLVHNQTSSLGKSLSFPIAFEDNGSLGVPKSIADGQNFTLLMRINTFEKREVEPVITFYNLNYTNVFTFGLGHFNISPSLNSFSKGIDQPLPPGYYIITLSNINGTYISGAVIGISNITVSSEYYNFGTGLFNFTVTSNGQPVSNVDYTINLNGTFQQNGTVKNGIIIYQLPPGTVIPYGREVFNIYIFGTRYTYAESYNQVISTIPPLYIEFAIVIIIVIIINVVAKAPERDEFYIDVQEFRHIDKVKMDIDKEEVLGIFDKVNYSYRWKDMPLTIDEVKGGISENIKQNNIPISITSYNTIRILNSLAVSGDLIEVDNYYVPKKWMSESGHNAIYLTIFRKLRDYCISNGMLFTDLGKSSIADMVISKSGLQAHVVIYSGEKDILSLKLSKTNKTFVVFLNEGERVAFLEKLYNSYGQRAEILKMSMYYDFVKLVDTDNLNALVF